MANKKLIKQFGAMYKQIYNITPSVYAGIALALHRKYGWEYEQINDLFMEVAGDMERVCAGRCEYVTDVRGRDWH